MSAPDRECRPIAWASIAEAAASLPTPELDTLIEAMIAIRDARDRDCEEKP